jgi:hypothetical protein
MHTVRIFVFTHFKWLFTLLLLSCIIVATLVLKHNGCLQNDNSPRSVLTLQQTFDKATSAKIIEAWKMDNCYCSNTSATSDPCADIAQCKKAIHYARAGIYTDFWLIPLYVLLLLTLLLRFNCRNPFPSFFNAQNDIENQSPGYIAVLTPVLMVLVVVAAVFDVIENIAMLYAFNNTANHNPHSFAIPAIIKMALLAIVVLYFLARSSAWLTRFILNTGQLLWRFRIAVFSLLLLAIPLWFTDQGQDILANINSNHDGPVGVFFTLSVLAVLNWHLPKMYTATEVQKKMGAAATTKSRAFKIKQMISRDWDDAGDINAGADVSYEKKAGRMFGILTFLIPACAISKALDVFKADHFFKFISPTALLALLVVVFYAIIRYNWLDWLKNYINHNIKNARGIILVIGLVTFILWSLMKIVSPAFGNSTGAERITTLQVNLLLMAVLFLLFTEYRGARWLRGYFVGTSLNWLIWAAAASCIVIFLLFNIRPLLLDRLNNTGNFRAEALPILIGAIIFHTVFFSLLLLWGRRFKTDLISIFLITGLAITLTGGNNFHTIRTLKEKNSLPATSAPSFKEYLKGWLTHRKNEINAFDTTGGRRYPFFLINSYGGGVRATAWTSMLLSRVDAVLSSKKMGDPFKNLPREFNHYTFATSGISGGTVGLAMNTSLLYKKWQHPGNQPTYPSDSTLSKFYESDFLSPVTTLLFGRDILASVLGISQWDDRSAVQEQIWEKQAKRYGLGNLCLPFRNIWKTDSTSSFRFEIPLLFSNTYHAEKGVQGILAPVKLNEEDFPSATIINTLELVEKKDMRLSTAAFISARFPYITPSARFGYEHHFIDGGAKEYSGCGTLYNIFHLIEKIRKEDPGIDSLMKKMQVYHFNIKNYIPREDKKVVTNPFEITLPLTAVINTGYGNTDESVTRLQQAVGNENSFMVQPTVKYIGEEDGCKNRYSPVLPLGWKISDKALERMWKGIDYEQGKTGSDFQRLLQVFD